MVRKKIDKEIRRAIRNARKMIAGVLKLDGNEAETRRRVERIFKSLMGYDVFKHISREHAIDAPGSGTTEYCDFAIQIDQGESAKPIIMVELKRVSVDISAKHLKQVVSYSINKGVEWIILTNGREWQLHHVSFAQPPKTKLVESWNLLEDDPVDLARKFDLVSYSSVRRKSLDRLWQKVNVLTSRNILQAVFSEGTLKYIRRELRKETGVYVNYEEIVLAIRKLLNERAGDELDGIRIVLPDSKRRKRPKKADSDSADIASAEPTE